MKILVASDGSECSQFAIDSLSTLCPEDGTEIQVLTAVEALPTLAALELQGLETARKHVLATVAKLKGELPQCQISGDVLIGEPDHGILATAERLGTDLIVLGTHGQKGFSGLLMGSVSRSVLLNAKCAVRIVKGPQSHEAAAKSYNVLVATNDSEESDAALDHILSRSWPENTKFLCVTALSVHQNKSGEEQEVMATSWLKCCVVRLNVKLSQHLPQHCAEFELLNGHPKEALIAKAASWPADLIVLGSRTQSLLGRMIRGSVSEAVATAANCSVEVLPMVTNKPAYIFVESKR